MKPKEVERDNMAPRRCTICDRVLVTESTSPILVCPLHGTRGNGHETKRPPAGEAKLANL